MTRRTIGPGHQPVAPHAGPSDVLARLRALRAAAVARSTGLVDGFDEIVEAASDVATDDEHDPEGHTIAWERQQIAALLHETRAALDQIGAAEQRLAAGRYGLCTGCGDRIAPERLDALPATPTCVGCSARPI